jgi:phosphoribosylformimino-5-aminoimidazole carboxamide ribotide isomerase
VLIIPAIDLRAGRCVRLVQGDFDRETVYADDPVRVAEHWAALGAPWIHVVDLDGARAGRPVQLDLIGRMAAVHAFVELGGGLRRIEDVRAALDTGVSRIVLGTAAIENPDLLRESVATFGPEAVILGVDARDGMVAVRGWETVSTTSSEEIIQSAREAGVERVIYTDIDRDGTLGSPNYDAIARVASLGITVIASGGVATRDHLARLATIDGVEAAIVGKALYAGTVTLHDPADWWVGNGAAQLSEAT